MSLNTQLYDRSAVLSVFKREAVVSGGNAELLNVDAKGTSFPSKQKNGQPGFRIRFHIEKVTGPVPIPNLAVIEIYNLGETNRSLISKLNNLIVLQAGYGSNIKNIFTGNISYGITTKVDSDYVTEIHAGDGMFAFQNSLINKSFAAPISSAETAKTLREILIPAGIQDGTITLPTEMYKNGIVLSGKVVELLNQIYEKNNLTWTIENAAINAIPYGTSLDKPVMLISPNTGLIGIPQVRAQNPQRASLVSFKILLSPDLGTFQLINMESKFIKGNFITAKITHDGDTAGAAWYTQVEAT